MPGRHGGSRPAFPAGGRDVVYASTSWRARATWCPFVELLPSMGGPASSPVTRSSRRCPATPVAAGATAPSSSATPSLPCRSTARPDGCRTPRRAACRPARRRPDDRQAAVSRSWRSVNIAWRTAEPGMQRTSLRPARAEPGPRHAPALPAPGGSCAHQRLADVTDPAHRGQRRWPCTRCVAGARWRPRQQQACRVLLDDQRRKAGGAGGRWRSAGGDNIVLAADEDRPRVAARIHEGDHLSSVLVQVTGLSRRTTPAPGAAQPAPDLTSAGQRPLRLVAGAPALAAVSGLRLAGLHSNLLSASSLAASSRRPRHDGPGRPGPGRRRRDREGGGGLQVGRALPGAEVVEQNPRSR